MCASSVCPSVWDTGDHTFQSHFNTFLVTFSWKWMLRLLSHHSEGSPLPCCFTVHSSPSLQLPIAGLKHTQWSQRVTNKEKAHWATSEYPNTTWHNKHPFLHTHSFRDADLPACPLTLPWPPSCASCFFHQHVFTGGGPLCLHYGEAINRKADPRV